MNSFAINSAAVAAPGKPYRVMVVDDSAIIRGFLCRYLSEDPDIDVVTTANNGKVALRQLEQHDIEAVVLDIEMPEMDGMTALPLIIKQKPGIQVVMASTLTLKNAEISLRAMQMGAVDYVPKPETARSVNASIDFRRELVEKVKAWAARSRKKRGETIPSTSVSPGSSSGAGFVRPERKATAGFVSGKRSTASVSSSRQGAPENAASLTAKDNITLRPGSRRRPKVLAVGSSTGGPQALLKFFAAFDKKPDVPVLITQHMPATFTSILANHLAQSTGWVAQEGKEGDDVRAGEIYIAPGGKHMEVEQKSGKNVIKLTDEPPENFCKPAVDPMFRSLVKIYGDAMLAVILTGMGHDGLKSSRELTKIGGTVLAQDEASSVVWGMPGAVATAGLCTEVLPLDEIGAATMKRLQGGL